jgi:hypothetical protein
VTSQTCPWQFRLIANVVRMCAAPKSGRPQWVPIGAAARRHPHRSTSKARSERGKHQEAERAVGVVAVVWLRGTALSRRSSNVALAPICRLRALQSVALDAVISVRGAV